MLNNVTNFNYPIRGAFGLIIFIGLGLIISLALITISYLAAKKKPILHEKEKLSPYECGFEPFGSARQKFDIRFYLVSLLFILFDLEVSYLFPLISIDHYSLKASGYIIAMVFLFSLTLGFIYETSKKALSNI